MATQEYNFDGIIGPTHFFAGLAKGNLASKENKGLTSNPKRAALQGLKKMKTLHDMGVGQAVLPPHERPLMDVLLSHGLFGTDEFVLKRAQETMPDVLLAAYSASCMWTANAATISPGADTADGKIHITPANLISQFHRSLETPHTAKVLQKIFNDPNQFVHHEPLREWMHFADEGAANHLRLCRDHGDLGLEIFVYGKQGFGASQTKNFVPRQTYEASRMVKINHQLNDACALLIQQDPESIDLGVFHNDVISVSNGNVLFCHERSFVDQKKVLHDVREYYTALGEGDLHIIEVPNTLIDVKTAVKSYIFNSQIVSLPSGGMAIIAPTECEEDAVIKEYLSSLVAGESPISEIHYLDLRQSMRNGGGPACLRLRVVLDDNQKSAVHPNMFMSDYLYTQLIAWVEKHYREELSADDFTDPQLKEESFCALDELTQLLDLGSLYNFQN